MAFDDAIKAAIDEVKKTDPTLKNTLIVVTADHDHTMIMQGYSKLTGKTTSTNSGVLGLLHAYTSPTTPKLDADGKPFTVLAFGNGPNRVDTRSGMTALTDADVSANDYRQESAIKLSSETHGGTDVFLGAIGMGSSRFTGTIDNTEVYGLVSQALGF